MTSLLTNYLLSLQDCIVSAGGVGHVCQPLLILPANGGRDVKACLHRQIIPPRKHAICGVEGHSFHKQRPPGCRRHTSASAASEQLNVSAFSRHSWFFSAGGDGWRFSDLQLLSPGADLCLSHTPDVLEPAGPMINAEEALHNTEVRVVLGVQQFPTGEGVCPYPSYFDRVCLCHVLL